MTHVSKVGYARVSSTGQKLDIQIEKLQAFGCSKIFTEKLSGLDRERPQLKECLSYLREGDIFVITRLDRLARSSTHLDSISVLLQKKKVEFVVLDQRIDTTGPMGKLMFQLLAAFAEFEWSLRKERQAEGIYKAKQQGIKLGRKRKLTPEQKAEVQQLRVEGILIRELMARFQVSRDSIYRALKS